MVWNVNISLLYSNKLVLFYFYCIFLIYFQYIALNHKLASTKTGIYIELVRCFFLGKILRMPMSWTQCGPDCSQWTGLTPTLKKQIRWTEELGEQHAIGQHQLKKMLMI